MSEEQLKTIRESITVNFLKLNYKIEKKLTNRNISIIFKSYFDNITQNSNFSVVKSHFIVDNIQNIINNKMVSFASPISPQISIIDNFQVNLNNANSYLNTDTNFISKYEEFVILDHFLENLLKMF